MTEKETMPRKPKVGEHIIALNFSSECFAGHVVDMDTTGLSTDARSDDTVSVYLFRDYGESWRFADETPAPADEREPRELTDEECDQKIHPNCFSYVDPKTTRQIIANYEAMRPGLLESGK